MFPPSVGPTSYTTLYLSNIFLLMCWKVLPDSFGSNHLPIFFSAALPASSSWSSPSVSPLFFKFNLNKANWVPFSSFTLEQLSTCLIIANPLKDYEWFANVVKQAALSFIPRVNNNPSHLKWYPSSPIWWNSICTVTVKARASALKLIWRSHLMRDFVSYQNCFYSSHTKIC